MAFLNLKGLNPQAPEYVPLSSGYCYYTSAPPRYDRLYPITSSSSIFTPYSNTPAVCCPPPPLRPYFPTLSVDPCRVITLYTTSNTYFTRPEHVAFIQPSSPEPAPEVISSTLTNVDRETDEVLKKEEVRLRADAKHGFERRGERIWKFGRRNSSCRSRGKREAFGLVQKLGHCEIRNRAVTTRRSGGGGEVLPLSCEEDKTTVMIKNIPNDYTIEMLIKYLDKHCLSENEKAARDDKISHKTEEAGNVVVSEFDFLYLPMDFCTGRNKGYAFVNFTDPRAAWRLYNASHGKKWECSQSPKITEIVCAKIQGKEALVRHFQKSTFECQSVEFLPVCFSPPRDGSVGKAVKTSSVGKHIPRHQILVLASADAELSS